MEILVKSMLTNTGVLLLVVTARIGTLRKLLMIIWMAMVKMLWYALSVVVVQVTGNETFWVLIQYISNILFPFNNRINYLPFFEQTCPKYSVIGQTSEIAVQLAMILVVVRAPNSRSEPARTARLTYVQPKTRFWEMCRAVMQALPYRIAVVGSFTTIISWNIVISQFC